MNLDDEISKMEEQLRKKKEDRQHIVVQTIREKINKTQIQINALEKSLSDQKMALKDHQNQLAIFLSDNIDEQSMKKVFQFLHEWKEKWIYIGTDDDYKINRPTNSWYSNDGNDFFQTSYYSDVKIEIYPRLLAKIKHDYHNLVVDFRSELLTLYFCKNEMYINDKNDQNDQDDEDEDKNKGFSSAKLTDPTPPPEILQLMKDLGITIQITHWRYKYITCSGGDCEKFTDQIAKPIRWGN